MKGTKLWMTGAIVRKASVALGLLAVIPAQAAITVAELKSLYGTELHVLGEVQRVDLSKGILIVAGQHVAISKDTTFSVDHVAVADSVNAFQTIQRGEVLAVSGPLDAPAVSVDRLNADYVAGATTIFVKGKISAVEESIGVAKIDELGVDFTPAMSDLRFATVEVGQVVEAIGVQPSMDGPMLANSITGTANSITGTANSITGTANSITGTAKSITGTAKSITGTANPITGTANSITGTANSITGTAN